MKDDGLKPRNIVKFKKLEETAEFKTIPVLIEKSTKISETIEFKTSPVEKSTDVVEEIQFKYKTFTKDQVIATT